MLVCWCCICTAGSVLHGCTYWEGAQGLCPRKGFVMCKCRSGTPYIAHCPPRCHGCVVCVSAGLGPRILLTSHHAATFHSFPPCAGTNSTYSLGTNVHTYVNVRSIASSQNVVDGTAHTHNPPPPPPPPHTHTHFRSAVSLL